MLKRNFIKCTIPLSTLWCCLRLAAWLLTSKCKHAKIAFDVGTCTYEVLGGKIWSLANFVMAGCDCTRFMTIVCHVHLKQNPRMDAALWPSHCCGNSVTCSLQPVKPEFLYRKHNCVLQCIKFGICLHVADKSFLFNGWALKTCAPFLTWLHKRQHCCSFHKQ